MSGVSGQYEWINGDLATGHSNWDTGTSYVHFSRLSVLSQFGVLPRT